MQKTAALRYQTTKRKDYFQKLFFQYLKMTMQISMILLMEAQICRVKKQGREPYVTNQHCSDNNVPRINVYSWQSGLISSKGAYNRQEDYCSALSSAFKLYNWPQQSLNKLMLITQVSKHTVSYQSLGLPLPNVAQDRM